MELLVERQNRELLGFLFKPNTPSPQSDPPPRLRVKASIVERIFPFSVPRSGRLLLPAIKETSVQFLGPVYHNVLANLSKSSPSYNQGEIFFVKDTSASQANRNFIMSESLLHLLWVLKKGFIVFHNIQPDMNNYSIEINVLLRVKATLRTSPIMHSCHRRNNYSNADENVTKTFRKDARAAEAVTGQKKNPKIHATNHVYIL